LQFTSFQFADAGPTNITGAGALAGTTVTITNLNIIPGVGYTTLSASGTNPYNFLVGPVAVTGTSSLSGTLVQGPTGFSSGNPSFAGLITLGGVTSLVLNGITLGSIPLPAGLGRLSGRSRENKLVHLPGPPELVGQIVDARIVGAGPYSLRGVLA
jgi:hypothetical protein